MSESTMDEATEALLDLGLLLADEGSKAVRRAFRIDDPSAEHPLWRRPTWHYMASSGRTNLGYWAWVAAQSLVHHRLGEEQEKHG